MLLMFGVGMHFSLRELWALRLIALPGAIVQILIATALGAALAAFWGWSIGGGLVLGLALSVASTVVLLRALEREGMVDSMAAPGPVSRPLLPRPLYGPVLLPPPPRRSRCGPPSPPFSASRSACCPTPPPWSASRCRSSPCSPSS